MSATPERTDIDDAYDILPAGRDTGILYVVFRAIIAQPATIVAAIVIVIFVVVAVLAPVLTPYNPVAQSILVMNKAPSLTHWLGTDQFGRDVLSRILYGSRNSLIFGITAPVLAATFGTTLGVVAGYFGGLVDRAISRIIDLLLAFPELLLAILISAAIGGGFWNVIGVLTTAFTPAFARLARASTLSVKREPYVEAAIAVGVRTPMIIFRHVVPNIAAPIVVLIDPVGRLRHPARSDAQLSRARHAAALSELGQHHPRRAQQCLRLALANRGGRLRDHLCRSEPQHHRRRRSRRARSGYQHMSTPLLKISHLSVEFGPQSHPIRVVDDVSFAVENGGAVGVVGESGSGKS